MRALLVLLLLTSCKAAAPDTAPSKVAEAGPCSTRLFENSRFTVCAEPGGAVEVHTASAEGLPYRSFTALHQVLAKRVDTVAFAFNAGMFDEEGNAIGLLIERGEQLHKINRRSGGGNFGLLPNGVFLVRDNGKAAVVETSGFRESAGVSYATQSGPMLVIDGKLHPRFDADGESRNIRNGVGIAPDGTPVFAISEEPVSFGKFARLFRDDLKVKNALYFDGSVSSLWDPANHRQDSVAELGPIVVVFRRETSAPGREGRARP